MESDKYFSDAVASFPAGLATDTIFTLEDQVGRIFERAQESQPTTVRPNESIWQEFPP